MRRPGPATVTAMMPPPHLRLLGLLAMVALAIAVVAGPAMAAAGECDAAACCDDCGEAGAGAACDVTCGGAATRAITFALVPGADAPRQAVVAVARAGRPRFPDPRPPRAVVAG